MASSPSAQPVKYASVWLFYQDDERATEAEIGELIAL